MDYCFLVTAAGRRLAAKLLAGETLRITKAMVGKGNVQTEEEIFALTDLKEPVALATSTLPVVSEESETVSFIVEYRNDLNGGLAKGFWLSEFGVFADDPDVGEVMIYYATLGEYPQYVAAYKTGRIDIRRYPVSISISPDIEAELEYPALAFMTAEDVNAAITHAGGLGGAYRLDLLSLPKTGWFVLGTPLGEYTHRYDFPVEECRESHYPQAALSVESLATAEECGLCPVIQALDGKIRFWAKKIPSKEITGSFALFAHGKYTGEDGTGSEYTLPAATAETLGGVRVGDGLEISEGGTLRVVGMAEDSMASDADVREIVSDSFQK